MSAELLSFLCCLDFGVWDCVFFWSFMKLLPKKSYNTKWQHILSIKASLSCGSCQKRKHRTTGTPSNVRSAHWHVNKSLRSLLDRSKRTKRTSDCPWLAGRHQAGKKLPLSFTLRFFKQMRKYILPTPHTGCWSCFSCVTEDQLGFIQKCSEEGEQSCSTAGAQAWHSSSL